MLTILLFCLILILQCLIIALMVTGWPGHGRAEIEKAAASLRRELVEQHAESIRVLHAIRIEVEDSVRESIERELADKVRTRGAKSAGKVSARGRSSAQGGALPTPAPVQPEPVAESPEPIRSLSEVELRQIPLFPELAAAQAPETPADDATAPPVPVVKEEMIFVGYVDDIPDVV